MPVSVRVTGVAIAFQLVPASSETIVKPRSPTATSRLPASAMSIRTMRLVLMSTTMPDFFAAAAGAASSARAGDTLNRHAPPRTHAHLAQYFIVSPAPALQGR